MLQVARLAPNLLGDSSESVVRFVESRLHPEGGFVDRAGEPDLYYSVFGIDCLIALQRPAPVEKMLPYLARIGDGEGLDIIHQTCLARCWAALDGHSVPDTTRAMVIERLEAHRTPDGGYNVKEGSEEGSSYGCFLAAGAYQDLGAPLPDPSGVRACLETMAIGDGSYTNDSDILMGNVPATAAAVTLQHQFGWEIDPKSVEFLLSCCHAEGGFFAVPVAPMPDLLSTAVALHALAAAKADVSKIKEPCLDFLDTLWTARGSFYGNWAEDEDHLDVEYTYYALLALGHLSL
ncbi:MAG: prenyltransferase/squalene oxidase repeat-containing protein [Planctomycetota bacterium]|jgi:hypothetical protein